MAMVHIESHLSRWPIRLVLGTMFRSKFLHRLFDSASTSQNLIATYDIVDVSKQEDLMQVSSDESIGVVIQGPIVKKLTFKMCSYLMRVYPRVKVVLSTWEDEDVSEFKNLIGENFEICQSKKPSNIGPSNINLQILSTIAGIKSLSKFECTHILKTRTDVFLGNPQFLNYLSWMKRKGNPQAIVFSSFNSFLFRLYSPTDQVMFGTAADITRYWSIDLVNQEEIVDIPERYLFQKYLKLNGFEAIESFSSYLASLKKFAVIADHEQLGQVWNKGVFTSLSFRWRGNTFPNLMSPLSAWLWESIKNDDPHIQKLYERIT
jgi:hypothetical protein